MISLLIVLIASVSANVRTLDEKNYCKANGFDSNVLECSTCKIVKDYIPDKELNEICMKCCNNFRIVCFYIYKVYFASAISTFNLFRKKFQEHFSNMMNPESLQRYAFFFSIISKILNFFS